MIKKDAVRSVSQHPIVSSTILMVGAHFMSSAHQMSLQVQIFVQQAWHRSLRVAEASLVLVHVLRMQGVDRCRKL
jgi:hypothetical protein